MKAKGMTSKRFGNKKLHRHNNIGRTFVALLLSCALLFSFVPAAFAVEEDSAEPSQTETLPQVRNLNVLGATPRMAGNGTVANPYLVYTVADLDEIRTKCMAGNNTSSYRQMADIDLSSVANFAPLSGLNAQSFQGKYDGNGYKIKNLTSNNISILGGLFGGIIEVTIENLGLENINILSQRGGGGIAASAMSRPSVIRNCYVTGAVAGRDGKLGGIIGDTSIGLSISNCYNLASVSGSQYISNIGGIIGSCNTSGTVTISSCYNQGDLSVIPYGAGKGNVGGIVGDITSAKISNCYNAGKISTTAGTVGGTVGVISAGSYASLTNNYWDSQTSGVTYGIGNINSNSGSTPKTTDQMLGQTFGLPTGAGGYTAVADNYPILTDNPAIAILILNAAQNTTGYASSKTVSATVQGMGGKAIDRVFCSTNSAATSGTAMTHQGSGVYKSGNITTAGTYYVIAYNVNGDRNYAKVEVTNIDNAAPSIGTPTQNTAAWATSKTVSATVTDSQSGVNRVFYSTDANATSGTAFTKAASGDVWTSPAITTAGTYYVVAYDNAGFRSVSGGVSVTNIDRTGPTIAGAAQNTAAWATQKTISATVTDTQSGVNRVFWSTANGATTGTAMTASGSTYTSGALTAAGTYYIVSYDGVGNRSQTAVTVNNIDRTAPAISGGTQSTTAWTGSKTISATVTDAGGSGLASVFYATNSAATTGTALTKAASGDVWTSPAIGTEGTYYIIAYDGAGNRTVSGGISVTNIDGTPPTVTSVVQSETAWTNGDVTLTVTAADTQSGLTRADGCYSFDGGATWQVSNVKTYTANQSGIVVKVRDAAGYVTTWNPAINITNIDKTAPTGSIKVGEHTPWTGFVDAITFGTYFKEKQPVAIASADAGGSGLAYTGYYLTNSALTKAQLLALGESEWTEYTALSVLTLEPDDKYIIYEKIADTAGNVTILGTDGMVFDATNPEIAGDAGVSVSPGWAGPGDANVALAVAADKIHDVGVTGTVSGEANVMSDIAHVYLMNAAGDTTVSAATPELTRQDNGNYALLLPRPNTTTEYWLRVVDKAGNWNDEAQSVKTVAQVDLTAPSVTRYGVHILPDGSRTISGIVTDMQSGVKEIYYAETADAASGVSMTEDPEEAGHYSAAVPADEKTYYLIAVDHAGNRVSREVQVGGVDRIPPDIWSIEQNTDGSLAATITDANSGVGAVYLSKDRDAAAGTPMTLTPGTAEYVSVPVSEAGTYYVIAYDNAGNRAVDSFEVKGLDVTPPILTAAQEPDDLASSKAIRASATDPAGAAGEAVSGVDETRIYYLLTDDPTAADGNVLTKQDDGTFLSGAIYQAGTYYVFGYDKAGNRGKNVAVTVDGIETGGGTPVPPTGTGGMDAYYQGGGSGADMDSTKALVWMNGTLFRTLDTGLYMSEHLVDTSKYNGTAKAAYSGSTLMGVMDAFGDSLAGVPGLQTVDLPDIGLTGKVAFPLSHGASAADTTGSELENVAYFPQGNTSRPAGLANSPATAMEWWTRTGYKTTTRVYGVSRIGQAQGYTATGTYGVRPEVYLDHNEAIFVPAGSGGGAPEVSKTLVRSMGAFHSLSADTARIWNAGAAIGNSQTYRVFRQDGTDAYLDAGSTSVTAATSSISLKISYEGASFGADNYLGVMLVNKNTHEKWAGRVANIDAADGKKTIELPKVDGKSVIGDSNYLLYVWNENEAGKNACSPLMYEMGDMELAENPVIVNITQQPEAWTGAGEAKTVTAEVKFSAAAADQKVEIAQNADGTGTKYTMTDNGDGTWSTEAVTTGGVRYVIATDATNGLSAVQAVTIKIDTTAPTITYAGLGRTNRIEALATDNESGMGTMYWSANADGSGAAEMTRADGVYTSDEITALGKYYVYAVDSAGNASAVTEVDITALYDTTPPDIGNIVFTKQANGKWLVEFTAEDIAKVPQPAVGVDPETVLWKAGETGTYVKAEQVDDTHFKFETDTDVENLVHFITAADYAGNTAVKEAINQTGVISVSVPTKMLFAALPNVFGDKFFAPEYTISNNSETNKLAVDMIGFEAKEGNGFTLAAPGTALAQNQMTLYLAPTGKADGFAGLTQTALLPGTLSADSPLALGKLGRKTTDGTDCVGTYTFAGDIPEFDLMALREMEAMRAQFGMVLRFGKDYTSG